jgi:hypothetical protein
MSSKGKKLSSPALSRPLPVASTLLHSSFLFFTAPGLASGDWEVHFGAKFCRLVEMSGWDSADGQRLKALLGIVQWPKGSCLGFKERWMGFNPYGLVMMQLPSVILTGLGRKDKNFPLT